MATNKASRDKIICELYKKNFQVGEIAIYFKISNNQSSAYKVYTSFYERVF